MEKQKLLKLKKTLLLASLISSSTFSIINNKIDVKAYNNIEQANIDDDAKMQSIDDYIEYYCNVFGLKETIIHDKLYDLTDNFNSYDWRYGNSINGKNYGSIEEAILMTIYSIYNDPQSFDLEYDKITSDKEYEVTMHPEEMASKYSDLFGINRNVTLSIMYAECYTTMGSENYLYNNNPAGLGPYMYFQNKEVGIIYFCNLLKNSYGCTKDSGTGFLNSIASTYCEIPDHWLSLTIPIYNNLSEDYLFYINEEDKKDYNISNYDNNKSKKLEK